MSSLSEIKSTNQLSALNSHRRRTRVRSSAIAGMYQKSAMSFHHGTGIVSPSGLKMWNKKCKSIRHPCNGIRSYSCASHLNHRRAEEYIIKNAGKIPPHFQLSEMALGVIYEDSIRMEKKNWGGLKGSLRWIHYKLWGITCSAWIRSVRPSADHCLRLKWRTEKIIAFCELLCRHSPAAL